MFLTMLLRLITTITILPLLLWPLILSYNRIWECLLGVFVFFTVFELLGMFDAAQRETYPKNTHPSAIWNAQRIWQMTWSCSASLLFLTLCWGELILFAWCSAIYLTLFCLFTLITRISIEHMMYHMLTRCFSLFIGLLPWICVWKLYYISPMGEYVLFLIAIVMGSDTGGYISGRLLGRTPLAPDLSPRKTWEGAVGALLISLILSSFVYIILGWNQYHSMITIVLWSVIGSCAAMTGDLFISGIKRYAQTKDSGQILPGHGGFLDRGDGFIIAAPVLWILYQSESIYSLIIGYVT